MKAADINRVLTFKAAVDHLRDRIKRAEDAGSRDLVACVELAALNVAMMRKYNVAMNHAAIVTADTDDEYKNWVTYFDDLLELATEKLLQQALGK